MTTEIMDSSMTDLTGLYFVPAQLPAPSPSVSSRYCPLGQAVHMVAALPEHVAHAESHAEKLNNRVFPELCNLIWLIELIKK